MVLIEFNNAWKPIEALSLHFSEGAVIGNSGATRTADLGEVVFRKRSGTNSASLILACASGRILPDCRISMFAEDKKNLIGIWKLQNPVIHSYSKTTRTEEEIILGYERLYRLPCRNS